MYSREVIEGVWRLTKLGNRWDNEYGRLLLQAYSLPREELVEPSFFVRKKSGDYRKILPAKPLLRRIQTVLHRWLSYNFKATLDTCYTGKGVLTALTPHLGCVDAVTLDLASAFDHVTREALCTTLHFKHKNTSLEVIDATTYLLTYIVHHSRGETTPQGQVSTPASFNAVLMQVDRMLSLKAKQMGLVYTRYADNLIFSGKRLFDHTDIVRAVKAFMGEKGFVVGRVEDFRETPVEVLGAVIDGDRIGINPNKMDYYYDVILEAIESPTPEDYQKRIDGMNSWVKSISRPKPPQEFMDLYRRYKEICRLRKTNQPRLF